MKIPLPSDNEDLTPEEEAEILKGMQENEKDAKFRERATRILNEYLRSLPPGRAYHIIRELLH